MKWFFLTFAAMIFAAALFVFGAMGQNGFLMLTMCPSAIVALWLNGFAASSSGKAFAKVVAKISGLQIVDPEQRQRPRNQQVPRQEYE